MNDELDSKVLEELRSLAAGKATFSALHACLRKIPRLIQLISNEGFASYVNGLDKAVGQKGYGNVLAGDSPEPVPYGRTSKEGLFFAHAFTSPAAAHKFALAKGIVGEGSAYPILASATMDVLYSYLLRQYGGVILDEGSDHRLVLNRKTVARLYAQLSIGWLSSRDEIHLLYRKGRPVLRTSGDGKIIAYCFDSANAASAGLRAIKAGGGAADSLSAEQMTTREGFRNIAESKADFVFVNKGLPDERPYGKEDIAKLVLLSEEAAGEKARHKRAPGRRYDSGPPGSAVLIPGKEAPFLEMWRGLPDVPRLFLPLDRNSTPEGRCRVVTGNMMEVANLLNKTPEGAFVGIVHTDKAVFVPGACYAAMPTAECVKQFFLAGRVRAVAFNPSLNLTDMPELQEDITYRLPQGYTLNSFVLPRLVGFVTSPDPYAAGTAVHLQLARRAASSDNPYLMYHHAASAREQGAALNEFYFPELDAMMALRLNEQVAQYLQWYRDKGGKDPRFRLYYARALTLAGQPDDAVPLLQPFLDDPGLAGFAWLERGRVDMVKKEFREAIRAFDECLQRAPGDLDAALGAGIAYRNIHYSAGDREGLAIAQAYFEKVAAVGGYHASEAYFHMGTIFLATENFAGCEDAMRRSLALRDTGMARRNLILALHAQGKRVEAYEEYTFLSSYSPSDADGLERYFSQQ